MEATNTSRSADAYKPSVSRVAAIVIVFFESSLIVIGDSHVVIWFRVLLYLAHALCVLALPRSLTVVYTVIDTHAPLT